LSATSATRPHTEPRPGQARPKVAKARLRSCVACRQKSAPGDLTRWVLAGEGSVLPDLGQGDFGRGAWLHPVPGCLKKAPGGFARSFKTPINSSPTELAELLGAAADRRILALLASAHRSRKLAVGRTAVENEIGADRCRLLVVATDAKSAAKATAVQQVVAAGGAVGWGTKDVLGGLVGRNEAGLLAVTDDGLACAVKTTIAMAHSARSAAIGGARSAAIGGARLAADGALGAAASRQRDSQRKVQKKSSTEVG
jgi:uncharacterized protein